MGPEKLPLQVRPTLLLGRLLRRLLPRDQLGHDLEFAGDMVLRLGKVIPLLEAGPPEESPDLSQRGAVHILLHVIRLIGKDDGLSWRDEEDAVLLGDHLAKLGRVSAILSHIYPHTLPSLGKGRIEPLCRLDATVEVVAEDRQEALGWCIDK